MASSVLITRPSNVAATLCGECRKLGMTVLHHPALEIVPLRKPLQLTSSDAYAITSQNALTPAVLDNLPQDAKLFAVGDVTAATLRTLGYANVIAAAGNGAALLELLTELPLSQKVVHLCGDELRVDIASELRKLGYNANAQQVYKTTVNSKLPQHILTALADQEIRLMPLFSPRTAKVMLRCLSDIPINAITAVCISQAVADVIKNKNWQNVIIQPKITAEYLWNCINGEQQDAR